MHRLHAVEWGSRRSRRVVVCAHGYSGNSRDFDFLARELSREARIVCPDMAGRGASAWLPTPLAYHFPQFLSDLRGLIAELGVESVEWVGTSMGGLLGMLLAAQPRSPISRLVMNDVGAFVPGEALASIGRNLRAPRSFETLASVEAHLRHTHREWGPIGEEQWRHLVRHGARRVGDGYALHYDPKIAQLYAPAPLSPDLSLWSRWYRVRCPVLVVRGARSEILPREVVDAMLASNPGARSLEIADAGHAPSLMQPGQVAAIAEFLAGGSGALERAA